MWTLKIKGNICKKYVKVCKMKLRNEEYNGKEQTGQEKRKIGNGKLSSTNLEIYTHYEKTYFFTEKLKLVTSDKK